MPKKSTDNQTYSIDILTEDTERVIGDKVSSKQEADEQCLNDLIPQQLDLSDDITAEEMAAIHTQAREEELSHTPNEGDPIRVDIVEAHHEFMTNFSAMVHSSFGSNLGLLSSLLNGNTEKNIAGLLFQRSEILRMLSVKMYRDTSLDMHSKVMMKRCSQGGVPKKVFFVPVFWFIALSTMGSRTRFLDHLPDLDSFDYVLWKLNIGNWHWVAVFHSPAPGSVLHYWDTYGSKQDRQRRMKDAMGATINRLAEKIDRSWVWDKGCAISEGTSLVHAPEQRKGSNDCGAAVNELGRRLVFGESVTSFDLAANGNLYRVRQASEILEFILQEGLQ